MSQPDIAGLCADLDALQRQRKFYIKLKNKQANAAGALVRQFMGIPYEPTDTVTAEDIVKMKAVALKIVAGDRPTGWEHIADEIQGPMAALRLAVEPLDDARHKVELAMKKVARKLPAAEWANSVRGLGELALAVIVAEAGDLSGYPDKGRPAEKGISALWKRLGLAPMNGKAMSTWRKGGGLSSEDWTVAGYSPKRLGEIYGCVTVPLFMNQAAAKDGTRPAGPYRMVYDRRSEATKLTHPEWTPKHRQNDAMRVMTKALVSTLWVEWRWARGEVSETTTRRLPDANPFLMAAE
jgi:hypothetical protein